MYKKVLSIMTAAAVLLTTAGLCGCSSENAASEGTSSAAENNAAKPVKIVTTVFPEYDWVNEILGDKKSGANVTLLLDNGVDLHSYQPTADDLVAISSCDMFIYIGGESDEWVEDALKNKKNTDMCVINLCEVMGDALLDEQVQEGMQHDHDHDHDEDEEHDDHDHDEDHEHNEDEEHEDHDDHDHEEETDEHIWLSLKNAQVAVKHIANKLAEIDSANADSYKANSEAYCGKLAELDSEYQKAVDGATNKTLLFGDRFPFLYMVNDYGLNYYAAFSGCSAETEASFETISFLADKVNELGLKCIFQIEGSQHKIAQTIAENSNDKNQEILTINSLQSVTSKDAEAGMTYLSVMKDNLEVLKKALN